MRRSTLFLIVLSFLVFACALSFLACGDDDDDNDDASDDDDDDDDDDDNDDSSQCEQGQTRCSDDALLLDECIEGAWVTTDCLAEQGRLCQDGRCVDPWRYGSPQFDACENDPDATVLTLVEKAEKYDLLAQTLHVHPQYKRLENVTVAQGYTDQNATWENVVQWHTGENDGLWTGLYIASQAFRYAATKEQQALDNLELMLEGMRMGMEITGVPGLFTREYINPDISGMACPANNDSYLPDVEKDDNRWVRVDTDGTILVWDGAAFERTSHVVPVEFAGYCWLDNVSKDEYSGHMLALGAVWMLVDDPTVRGLAEGLLDRVGSHFLDNGMVTVDWDGRITEHGRYWPLALDDWPGYNAILGLSYIQMAAAATGRPDLHDFYTDCLLQQNGPNDCLPHYLTPPVSYADFLKLTGLYWGHDACKANWNNFAMTFVGMFTLVWYERDAALRAQYQDILENTMFTHRGNVREMRNQLNAAWSLIAASMKNTGPGSTGQDVEAVNGAICALRQFPESQAVPTLDVGEQDFPINPNCESRFAGEFLTFDPVPVYQRCPSTFIWWGNPYEHQHCTENLQSIRSPADYLLPYWMARYFGYIDQAM